jgi:hypothetical protein
VLTPCRPNILRSKPMAGRNQHHIPQFLQRGFGVRRSGKPKEIWKYRKGIAPEPSEIKHTAAEHCFYSSLSDDGTKTLDDQITDIETSISRKVNALRRTPVGSVVDSTLAAEVLIHLAPRTSHLRSVFAHGVTGLIEGVREVFTDKANLAALLGLDADQPSARFQRHIADHFGADSLFAQLGLPPVVLEQVAFQLVKENFSVLVEEQIPLMKAVLETMALTAPKMARDGHNKALTKMVVEGSKRDDLLAYRWTVEAAPPEGAVLPDCVAIALLEGGIPRPFIGSSSEEVRAILVPLSTDVLLVGTKEGAPLLALDTLNAAAAACSHEFFLAATDAHSALTGEIGRVATTDVEEGLNSAIQEFRLKRELTTVAAHHDVAPADEAEIEEGSASGSFSYQVSCFDFGDRELVGSIAEELKYIIAELARIMPLERLDGITFAADYPAALDSIDRGRPNIATPRTVSKDIGVGVAMTLTVERDGLIKGHIVLTAGVGLGLIGEAGQYGQWALHTLVHELAEVSMIQLFDEALPGVILNPLTDGYEGPLFVSVNNALDGYSASRVSSCFGDSDEIMRVHQELLVSTLAVAQQKISKARFAYRYDGDIQRLVNVARPLVGHILSFSAELLGHANGLRSSPFDEEGVVKAALEKAGLLAWFKTFETDLHGYWDRRGQWESLDELFRFNRHVERIFWQFGMFWSREKEGGCRLDIPVAIDALRLLEATARGVPIPNL